MCLCLCKRGKAAHFQLINTADRACWRKPHYAAGWWVGWVGVQNCYHDSVKGRKLRTHSKPATLNQRVSAHLLSFVI